MAETVHVLIFQADFTSFFYFFEVLSWEIEQNIMRIIIINNFIILLFYWIDTYVLYLITSIALITLITLCLQSACLLIKVSWHIDKVIIINWGIQDTSKNNEHFDTLHYFTICDTFYRINVTV